MTPSLEQDYRVMTILKTAFHLPEGDRNGYLRVACQGNEELFQEIADALEWEERMGNFLREPLISLQDLERPFQAGEVIAERFEIIREIGEGGMGVVYEAFDRKRNQRIAIKSAKLGFRRLLTPELEIALKVRHANICLVNEIHSASTEYGDVDFLTMEFLDGQTLSAMLSLSGALKYDEALDIARQLCSALSEAHRSGVIHRDLKSANVILCRSGEGTRAVITDFGLATEATLDPRELAGTPGYMAPELWRGDRPSTASDIYALGVILYEMVTGAKPFTGQKTESRLTSHPVAPSAWTKALDSRWDAAILRCLDPSPAARPNDAKEVLALLERRPVLKTLAKLAAFGMPASATAPRLRRTVLALASVFLLLGVGALTYRFTVATRATNSQYKKPPDLQIYDTFGSGFLDRKKWFVSSTCLGCSVEAGEGYLRLAARGFGRDNSNEGTTYVTEGVDFTDPASLEAIEVRFVINSINVVGCQTNPEPATPQFLIHGNFFNTSNGSIVDDMVADLLVAHSSDSGLPSTSLHVTGFLRTHGQFFDNVDLGTLELGEPATATLRWNRLNKVFIVRIVRTQTLPLVQESTMPYTQPDTRLSSQAKKRLQVSMFAPNCVSGKSAAAMDARIESVRVNQSSRY